jgi:tetratricopeptide (TPR) repeat protein
VVALERVNPKAALAAYESALTRWPTDRSFLLGRGNAAYALGNLPAAQNAYAAAKEAQPDFADAWNNLAQVLLEQRQWAPAQAAIAKAVALGGPRLPDYLTLQKAITAAQPL